MNNYLYKIYIIIIPDGGQGKEFTKNKIKIITMINNDISKLRFDLSNLRKWSFYPAGTWIISAKTFFEPGLFPDDIKEIRIIQNGQVGFSGYILPL